MLAPHIVAKTRVRERSERSNMYAGSQHDRQYNDWKGATLGEWTSFFNDNKNEIYDAAVEVKGSDERKKGSTKFKVPVFALKKVSEDTNETAKLLDTTLQQHLSGYLLGQDFEAKKQVADKVLNEVVEDDLPF